MEMHDLGVRWWRRNIVAAASDVGDIEEDEKVDMGQADLPWMVRLGVDAVYRGEIGCMVAIGDCGGRAGVDGLWPLKYMRDVYDI